MEEKKEAVVAGKLISTSETPFPIAKESQEKSKKRDHALVLYLVLVAIRHFGRPVKTHIMYAVNLSFSQQNEAIEQLETQKLITVTKEGNKTYLELTEEGIKALQFGKRFLKMIGEI